MPHLASFAFFLLIQRSLLMKFLRQSLLLDDDRIRLLVDSDSGNKISRAQVGTREGRPTRKTSVFLFFLFFLDP